ncbi:membrane protein YdbS with pleckstrin-like domain [Microbacterium proteolyticum]|nr:membrane protein YdbS with pleckstrin-like domain [Microbacterium sp. SORGH_AS_0344]MDQ1170043.1 membrane protein YdbS with pleckstrin-like domain [Microbacterium proteolyticum]
MSSPEKGPVARFVSAAWAVLFACIMLWAAVWIIRQIIWWLVALAVVAVLIWVAALLLRWRRDRWLR